jgi:hypothetical protein
VKKYKKVINTDILTYGNLWGKLNDLYLFGSQLISINYNANFGKTLLNYAISIRMNLHEKY